MTAEELAHEKKLAHEKSSSDNTASLSGSGTGTSRSWRQSNRYWCRMLAVGIPLVWGVALTLQKAVVLFK